jgi:hypothetical protein
MLQKLIYSIFIFFLQNFIIFTFLFLELFLDEPAMVLRYFIWRYDFDILDLSNCNNNRGLCENQNQLRRQFGTTPCYLTKNCDFNFRHAWQLRGPIYHTREEYFYVQPIESWWGSHTTRMPLHFSISWDPDPIAKSLDPYLWFWWIGLFNFGVFWGLRPLL